MSNSDVRRVHLVNEGKYGYQCTMCYKIYNTKEDIGEHLAEKELEAMMEESK
tara:strand:- start:1 stop:156 length:156 start_codon:yes stop_codon:yes gene_type:complete